MKQTTTLLMILFFMSITNVFAQSNEQSEIKITFEAYTGVTEPLDPDTPSNLLIPTGQGTGAAGPLSIDYVPTLKLGNSQKISTFEQTFPIVSDRPFLQVTDLRGTGSGWNVRVAISDFIADDSTTLPGASLAFYDGTPISPNMTAQEPDIHPDVTAYAGAAAVELITAYEGSGKGTWLARWYDVPDSEQVGRIEVIIPGGVAYAKTYTAKVNWQLMDVV